MSSSIAAITTGTGGVITTADNSGNLNLVSGTTTIVALTSAGIAVTGDLSATGITTVAAGTAALPAVVSATGTADTGLWFPAADTVAASTAGAERLRIDSSGNVGIGTSSPTNKLHVSSSSFETIKLQGTSTVSGINFVNSVYSNGYIYYDNGPNMLFYTNGSERARIDSSGSVLVGTTTTPAQNVKGIYLSIGGQQSYQKLSHGTLTTAAEYFYFYNGNGQVGSISSNGSTTSYTTSSDYRLKNTIAPMTGALAKISLLKPVTYKWNADGSDGQGFIAHELQEVVEGCVTGEKDATREEEYEVTPAVPAVVDAEGVETTPAVQAVSGIRTVPKYQGVDTSFLVATLTAAIQELKAIIDTQAAQIAALNKKVGI